MVGDHGRELNIRHLVEVDCEPDTLAYILRLLSSDAEKWCISRLGHIWSTRRISGLSSGLHWTGLNVEILPIADTAYSLRAFHRQFSGANSLRVLRCKDVEHILIKAYTPDVVISETSDLDLPGMQPGELRCGDTVYNVAYASYDAEEAMVGLTRQAFSYLSEKSALRVYNAGVDRLILWDGFHKTESDGHMRWAWTGAKRSARFFVPSLGPRPQLLSIFAHGAALPFDQNALAIFVNGARVPCRYLGNDLQIEAEIKGGAAWGAHLVEIRHNRLTPTSDGSRDIGIALKAVKLGVI